MTTNQVSEEDFSLLDITQEPNTPQWLTEEEIAELYEDSLITNVPFYRAEGFARDVERLTISKLQAECGGAQNIPESPQSLMGTGSEVVPANDWQPIETAPKDKTILLGHRNSHGHWRTLLGEWFSQEEIDELWEDPDGVEPGWFETSVEADDVPNVWHTNPTHWMPLPEAPKQETEPAIREDKGDFVWRGVSQ